MGQPGWIVLLTVAAVGMVFVFVAILRGPAPPPDVEPARVECRDALVPPAKAREVLFECPHPAHSLQFDLGADDYVCRCRLKVRW